MSEKLIRVTIPGKWFKEGKEKNGYCQPWGINAYGRISGGTVKRTTIRLHPGLLQIMGYKYKKRSSYLKKTKPAECGIMAVESIAGAMLKLSYEERNPDADTVELKLDKVRNLCLLYVTDARIFGENAPTPDELDTETAVNWYGLDAGCDA